MHIVILCRESVNESTIDQKRILDGDGKNWYRKRCLASNYATRNGTNRMQNVKRMSQKNCTAREKSPVKAGKETVNKRKCSDILYTKCSSVKSSFPLNYVHHR